MYGQNDVWVIGPLGQPVRKTLEVGHRGAQRAFNQKDPTQNPTPNPTQYRGGGGGGGLGVGSGSGDGFEGEGVGGGSGSHSGIGGDDNYPNNPGPFRGQYNEDDSSLSPPYRNPQGQGDEYNNGFGQNSVQNNQNGVPQRGYGNADFEPQDERKLKIKQMQVRL